MRQTGYVVAGLIGLMALFCLVAMTFLSNGLVQRSELLDQHFTAVQMRTLKHELLLHASLRGYNSHSHPGNLPCPAISANAPPAVRCDSKPVGFLPSQTHYATNYINPIITSGIGKASLFFGHWNYEVSPKVVQPNALNWSQWVDWTLSPPADTATDKRLIAVVKLDERLSPAGRSVNARLQISETDMQSNLNKMASTQAQSHINLWKQSTKSSTTLPPLINLTTGQPIDDNCKCRCTKTRCNCSCDVPTMWQSDHACQSKSAPCNQNKSVWECESNIDKPCIFSGSASLSNQWPISRYSPAPVAGKACRPKHATKCPLSTSSHACECEFSWPSLTLSQATNIRVFTQDTFWTVDTR